MSLYLLMLIVPSVSSQVACTVYSDCDFCPNDLWKGCSGVLITLARFGGTYTYYASWTPWGLSNRCMTSTSSSAATWNYCSRPDTPASPISSVLAPTTTLRPTTTSLAPTTTLRPTTTSLAPTTTVRPTTTSLAPTTTLQLTTTSLNPTTTLIRIDNANTSHNETSQEDISVLAITLGSVIGGLALVVSVVVSVILCM